MPDITRRTALQLLAATAALAAGGVAVTRALTSDDSGYHAVARVGELLLHEYPDLNDRSTLSARVPALAGKTGRDAYDHLGGLRTMVTQDFERGDVISVDGWRLARTGAHASMLVALGR